ncbi:MAG: hypothetical protein ACTSQI_12445 [Candidatus Helarchaeota archaeon]
MAEIYNLFILKDGIPIFHVNPVRALLENNQTTEVKPDTLDSALIAGFLSAIAGFAYEIGVGAPITYETTKMKFSFLAKNDFLFILGTQDVESTDIQEILQKIANNFLDMILRDELNPKIADFSPFNEQIKQIMSGFIRKYDLLRESHLIEEYIRLVPHSHIVPETLEKLSETRRLLFKLIDGTNSIFKIAEATNKHPRELLSILRSYSKSGIITFQHVTE